MKSYPKYISYSTTIHLLTKLCFYIDIVSHTISLSRFYQIYNVILYQDLMYTTFDSSRTFNEKY